MRHFTVFYQTLSAAMRAIIFIFIAMAVGLFAILLWFLLSFQKYKKQHGLSLWLLLLSSSAPLSAQYIDGDCYISFKWQANRMGVLECDVEGMTLEFVPGSSKWEIKATNTTEADAQICWDTMQLIVNGMAAKIDFGGTLPQTTIGSHSQITQTISAYNMVNNKKDFLRIYDKATIRKGRNAAVTVIVPISVGGRPRFFHTFNFIVAGKP